MPKRNKINKVHQEILSGLIETRPTSWNRKVWTNDEDGLTVESTVKVTRQSLRFPFAQNMSEESVDALAKRWLP
jgi:hypothetical protein